MALISLKSCILLRHGSTHDPFARKGVLLKSYAPFCQTRTVCGSCLSQQHCSHSSSIAIISVTVRGHFLCCSYTRPSFLLSLCADLSAALCLSNIAIKQYPIVAVFIGNCCVVFLCLLNLLNCLLDSKNVSNCNGWDTVRALVKYENMFTTLCGEVD